MKKKLKRRIISTALALVMGLSTVGFMKTDLEVYAGERKATDSKTWYDDEDISEYTGGTRDYTNGEKVLRSFEKANILGNIYARYDQDGDDATYDILEIVPYHLASIFQILVPQEDAQSRLASYGDAVFAKCSDKLTNDGKSLKLISGDNSFQNAFHLADGTMLCNELEIDMERQDSVNYEGILDQAEVAAGLAALAVAPDSVGDNTAILDKINQSLSGLGVTAQWKDELAKSVTLMAADGSTRDVDTVSTTSVAPGNVEDVTRYLAAVANLKLYLDGDGGNLRETIRSAIIPAFDALGNEYKTTPYVNIDSTSETKDTSTPGSTIYSYGVKYNDGMEHVFNYSLTVASGSVTNSSYTVTMDNYYMDNLFDPLLAKIDPNKDKASKKKYESLSEMKEYFSVPGRVRIHTVTPAELTSGSFEYDGDKVDLIYVGGPTGNRGILNRNAFFQNYFKDGADSDSEKVAQFIRDGSGVDDLFHTGVYKADGTEYKFSELNGNLTFENTYSMTADGLVPNSMSWDDVNNIMAYVFNSNNEDMKGVDESGEQKLFRVPVMYETAGFNTSNSYTSNVAKLYYLLCKSTDQEDTVALDTNIRTCYYDSNYFAKNMFDDNGNVTGVPDGSLYINYQANMLKTDDNTYVSKLENLTSTSSFSGKFNDGLPDTVKDTVSTALGSGNVWILTQDEDFYRHMLKNEDWNNNNYFVYNGIVGMNSKRGNGYSNLLFSAENGGSFNKSSFPQADYRLGDDDGTDFFSINDYLLGLDDGGYPAVPLVRFTYAQQGTDESTYNPAYSTNNKKVRPVKDSHYVSTYDPATGQGYKMLYNGKPTYSDVIYNLEEKEGVTDEITFYFYGMMRIDDEDAGEILPSMCEFHTVCDGTDTKVPVTLTETKSSDGLRCIRVDGSYTLHRGTPEYTAFQNRKLSLKFVVYSSSTLMEMPILICATDDLKLVYRNVHDLD